MTTPPTTPLAHLPLYRSLAKDGARRAEVRRICSEPLIDYSGASWGEWWALAAVAEECAALVIDAESRPYG